MAIVFTQGFKMEWNFDISQAPQGRWVEKVISVKDEPRVIKNFMTEQCLIASKCGKVFTSYKLRDGRWNGLTKDEQPIAWAKLLEHPNA